MIYTRALTYFISMHERVKKNTNTSLDGKEMPNAFPMTIKWSKIRLNKYKKKKNVTKHTNTNR